MYIFLNININNDAHKLTNIKNINKNNDKMGKYVILWYNKCRKMEGK
jgi:hypothetical protein